MPLEPLSKCHEAYEKAFQVYLDNYASRQAVIVKCVEDGMKQALREIATVDKNKPFRILGIGSGKGQMDLLMIQFIAARMKTSGSDTIKSVIQSVVVEPSSFLLEEFKESASSLPSSLTTSAEVSFEWREMTFQEYQRSCASESSKSWPSFDFIHFIHSIYYTDATDTLRSCFEQQLGEKGAILSLVLTKESWFVKMQEKFKGRLMVGSEGIVMYTMEDLARMAAQSGWLYDVITHDHGDMIDISICFGAEPTEQSDLLLDFLTHQKNFRATADQALFDEVMTFIQGLMITDKTGGKFLKTGMAAVIIHK